MKKIYDIVIEKNSNVTRENLLELNNSNSKNFIKSGTSVVYLYKLVDNKVKYPNREGDIIYIGEAGRRKEGTGKRFSQHISKAASEGGDTGGNYTISNYYWNGYKIKLEIYEMENGEDRKIIEKNLIQYHVRKFGARPIAQGCSGKNYTVNVINNINLISNIISI